VNINISQLETGSHSNVTEDSGGLECGTVSMSKCILTIWTIISNHSPIHMLPHSRRHYPHLSQFVPNDHIWSHIFYCDKSL
jgi:hypothetical protein